MTNPVDLAMKALEVLRTEPMARTAADKAQALLEQIEKAEQAQPVAWMYDFLNPDSTDEVIRNWVTQDLSEIDGAQGFNVRPLYTAPLQRQWVSLTEEEIDEIEQQIWSQTVDKGESMKEFVYKFARAIEAAHNIK